MTSAIASALDAAAPLLPLDAQLAREMRNDLGNARRLIARFGRDLMYVDRVGWFAWVETHWSRDEGAAQATRLAHETSRRIFDEARAIELEGPRPPRTPADGGADVPGESGKDFEERLAGHRKWALGSGNTARINSMLEAAQPYLRRPIEALDADPLRMAVRNGTLVFARGGLGAEGDMLPATVRLDPHRREDLITRLAPVDYDPKATARPVFDAFLAMVQPTEAVRLWLRDYLGYCLTGETGEQMMALWWGDGANGKGTLIRAVSAVLGDYVATIDIATLLHDDRRSGSQASPDIARLPGVRLVIASEPEQGARLSESRIKALTGEDVITARHLNQDFFEFVPQFKMVVSFNPKPQIRGTDHGTWRRLKLTPWPIIVPRELRDRGLHAKLRAEAAGILNWLVEGALAVLADGLVVPAEVDAASEEYRSESNPLTDYVNGATIVVHGKELTADEFYKHYVAWCRMNSREPLSGNGFGRRIVKFGVTRRVSGVTYYIGRALVELPRGHGSDGHDPRPEPPAHHDDG